VVILADAAEPAHEIDLKRAEAAADRAREKLERARSDQEIDADRAAAALVRAINRLKVAKQQM
jgi:F-type H+-transporting ATPase subunit epsilon